MQYIARTLLMLLTVTLMAPSSSFADSYGNGGDLKTTIIAVEFTRHTDFPRNMPVQDVYIILNETTPDLVYRATPEQAMNPEILAKEAYATTNHTPHDPMMESPNPIGPFPKGKDLGFTLGDWLAAKGGGNYTLVDENATMDFTFQNLIPNGTYTVWWAGVTSKPPYKYVVAPAGASDGSENVFYADESGNVAFHVVMPALPPGTNETRTLIVVRYHSDGKAPGATPGEYGKIAHVQLLYRMPLPGELSAAQTLETTAAQPREKQPGLGFVSSTIGLLAIAYLMGKRGAR